MVVKMMMMPTTGTVTGAVTIPHGKLHVLFGLILMTQYFTTVTTSVSLDSAAFPPSSSGKSSLSLSASDSSSFSLPPSIPHPSSSSSRKLAPSFQPHHHRFLHRSKNGDFHLVPYNYFIPTHTGSGNDSRSRLSWVEEEEVPLMATFPNSLRKHQKRHSGNENSTRNSGNNNNHRVHHGGNRIGESESERNAESHLLPTPTIIPSLPSGVLTSSSKTDGAISSTSVSSPVRPHQIIPIPIINDFEGGDSDDFPPPMCRHKRYMPPTIYTLDTCAWCYKYMKNETSIFGKPSKKLNETIIAVLDVSLNKTYWIMGMKDENGTKILANVSDTEHSPILATFVNKKSRTDWIECCGAAKRCCERVVASRTKQQPELDGTTAVVEAQGNECPPTWDGWQCWNSTKPGITAESHCPNYVYFLTEAPACAMPLVKTCDANGTWAKHRGSEWTNYSICAMAKVVMQRNRTYVLVTAYAVSIVALLPAIIIFFSFKQLRVHRIILHQNLFFSLILNALLIIILNTSVMMGESNVMFGSGSNSVVGQNGIACRLLLISTKYLRLTNYMWMLCEGYYLHKLIAAAFAEQKSLLVFYLIGWVFPLFPTAFYAGYRIIAANDECWVVPQEKWEWALNGPSLLSLLVNTLFLINIIRVLVTKLRAAHAQEPSQYRKAVRATLVLLPLFGLHFIVTIYRPSSSTGLCGYWTELYFYANDVLDGMQGFLVALIFCYCNGEVISLLKRAYTRWREQHFDMRARSNSRHRPSRGSVMGRSVVSTHIYSSIPPSPETNVIALPGGGGCTGSNNSSHDPSPITQDMNLLTVNGTTGIVTIPCNPILLNNEKVPEIKSVLKNRKNNLHTTNTATNGNAINTYVSSEYGCVKGDSGLEISCV